MSSEPSISAKTQMRGYKMCMPSTAKTVLCMGPSLLHHAKIVMRSSRLFRAFTRHTSPRRVNLQSPLNLIKDVSRDSKRGTQSSNQASASSKRNSKLYIGKGTKKLKNRAEACSLAAPEPNEKVSSRQYFSRRPACDLFFLSPTY